eukprot:214432-Rhodomonas_salina.1
MLPPLSQYPISPLHLRLRPLVYRYLSTLSVTLPPLSQYAISPPTFRSVSTATHSTRVGRQHTIRQCQYRASEAYAIGQYRTWHSTRVG